MPRFAPLSVAALALLFTIQPLAAQSKKNEPKEGMKKKKFHESLFLEYTAEKGKWFDLEQRGLGLKYKDEGVVLFMYRNFWETPGGRAEKVLKFEERKVPPTNTSKVVKELQKAWSEGFKKLFWTSKNKKFKCKAGKGVYCDFIAAEPESKDAQREMQYFTTTAAGVDASKSWNPKTEKIHMRITVIRQKEGVHFITIMASDGVLKTHRKEVDKVLKSFTAE